MPNLLPARQEIGVILAIDTSTAACSVALLADGVCLATRDEIIERGHAERLAPMIADLLEGRRAERVLVGCGPGSFTGLRVGIAAAQGLAIGWDVPVAGLSSLALLAAEVDGDQEVASAMKGGHGELFVQQFEAGTLRPSSPLLNLPPADAARAITAGTVVGPGAAALVEARGTGRAVLAYPRACNAVKLPSELAALTARPIYGRPPDAKVREAA